MEFVKTEELYQENEADQMMYDFPDLLEEFKICRDYLGAHLINLSEDEFHWVPDELGAVSIAQHVGHVGYTEKELGKKAEVVFSFRLDIHDDIFSETDACIRPQDLPTQSEIMDYLHQIHQTFMDDIRFSKKQEALFALINHTYEHTQAIRHILTDLGHEMPEHQPPSKRVREKESDDETPLYCLPVYAN